MIAAYLRAIGLVWEGDAVPCYPVGVSHRLPLGRADQGIGADTFTACCVGAPVSGQEQMLGRLLQ